MFLKIVLCVVRSTPLIFAIFVYIFFVTCIYRSDFIVVQINVDLWIFHVLVLYVMLFLYHVAFYLFCLYHAKLFFYKYV